MRGRGRICIARGRKRWRGRLIGWSNGAEIEERSFSRYRGIRMTANPTGNDSGAAGRRHYESRGHSARAGHGVVGSRRSSGVVLRLKLAQLSEPCRMHVTRLLWNARRRPPDWAVALRGSVVSVIGSSIRSAANGRLRPKSIAVGTTTARTIATLRLSSVLEYGGIRKSLPIPGVVPKTPSHTWPTIGTGTPRSGCVNSIVKAETWKSLRASTRTWLVTLYSATRSSRSLSAVFWLT